MPMAALLATGVVRHRRLRPAAHAFAYPTWFLLLPMRALRAAPDPHLPRNRGALVSFHDADHGDGGPDALAWVEALLAREGVAGADGEIWLQTYPRMLGYAFKPVSFWYCHRTDGSLAAVLAEVNNTFGERHVYLLDGPGTGFGRELIARKVFHVSPFCGVEGQYRMATVLSAGAGAAISLPAPLHILVIIVVAAGLVVSLRAIRGGGRPLAEEPPVPSKIFGPSKLFATGPEKEVQRQWDELASAGAKSVGTSPL